jgi:hypothetical protein
MDLLRIFIGTLLVCSTAKVAAADVHGRATVGGYFAKERFSNASGEEATNDAASLSGRGFLDLSNLGANEYRFVLDIRDKNDFFDKLDKEKLELTPKNSVQLRQLYVQYPNSSGKLYGTLGRFSAFDAGVVYADGAEIGFRPTSKFRLGLFGGASPKYEAVEAFDKFGSGRLFGGFGIFQSTSQDWYEYSSVSTAFVSMAADKLPTEEGVLADTGSGYATGEFERSFVYNNSILQFNRDTRLIALIYFDVKPTTNLQNMWLSLYRRFSPKFSGTLSGLRIESTEYRKTQDLREKLEPSSYSQGKLDLTFRVSDPTSLIASLIYGHRDVDDLKRTELSAGALFSNFISNKFSASALAGVRKKFTTSDVFARVGLGRYSRMFETTIDFEYATETRITGDKKQLHPTKLEIGIGTILSSKIFGTLAVQQTKDEEVSILSGLFRISTRFGNKEIPPVRDGAPARGSL